MCGRGQRIDSHSSATTYEVNDPGASLQSNQFAAGAADAVGTIGNTIREVVACSDGSTSTGSLLEVSAVAAAALGVPLQVLRAR